MGTPRLQPKSLIHKKPTLTKKPTLQKKPTTMADDSPKAKRPAYRAMILTAMNSRRREVSRGVTKQFISKVIIEDNPSLADVRSKIFNNSVRAGMEKLIAQEMLSSIAEGFGAGNKFKLTDKGKKGDVVKKASPKKSPVAKKKASPKKKAAKKVTKKVVAPKKKGRGRPPKKAAAA